MKTKTVTIVGGGTSAWLTAAYLSKNNSALDITVVDKEIGTPVGVGEATLLNFKSFMDECGFNEKEWMVEVSAGYKSAIMFTNWREPGNDIWHPFYKNNKNIIGNSVSLWNLWSKTQDLDFKKYALGMYDSSVLHNTIDVNDIEYYAHHVDCGKLVVYIQNQIKNKINIIQSDVVSVDSNDDKVNYIELKNGQQITSDLYVDCTGFNQVLRTPSTKIDLQDRLFVNTAVACPVPYQDKDEEFKPYAVCEGVDHGWIWKIGVETRIGSGMVFNRHITDIEEAKDYFVAHWNNRISKDKVRVINWDPFYIQDQWKGNVVNIGLSAGFIEPLESTSIGLITVGATQLSNALCEQRYIQDDINYYNQFLKTLYEDAVDFVSAHYANNLKTTNFWNYVKDTFVPSSRMLHHLELLKDPAVPVPFNGRYNYMFGGSNWTLLLQQLGYPVSPRNIPIGNDDAKELLIKHYVLHEKNRHTISRHHNAEISRLNQEYNILK